MVTWKDVSYLVANKHRRNVASVLTVTPKTPLRLSQETATHMKHVSLALKDLRSVGMVQRLTPPHVRKGKLFTLTSKGRRTLRKTLKLLGNEQ